MKPEEYKQRDRERLQTKAKRLINANPVLAEFYKTSSKKDQEELQHLITSIRYYLALHASALDPIILSTLLSQQKQILNLQNDLAALRIQVNQNVEARYAPPSPRLS